MSLPKREDRCCIEMELLSYRGQLTGVWHHTDLVVVTGKLASVGMTFGLLVC